MTEVSAPIELNSEWTKKDGSDPRIWVVIDKKPFGRLTIMQKGRAYFGPMTCRTLRADYCRQA